MLAWQMQSNHATCIILDFLLLCTTLLWLWSHFCKVMTQVSARRSLIVFHSHSMNPHKRRKQGKQAKDFRRRRVVLINNPTPRGRYRNRQQTVVILPLPLPTASLSTSEVGRRTARVDDVMDVDPTPVVVQIQPEDARRHASGTFVWFCLLRFNETRW